MTAELCTVNAQWLDPGNSADVPSGNYLWYATGTLADSSDLAISIAAIHGDLDDNGSMSVQLLASDSFGVQTVGANTDTITYSDPVVGV
jgi:hypothetical protein